MLLSRVLYQKINPHYKWIPSLGIFPILFLALTLASMYPIQVSAADGTQFIGLEDEDQPVTTAARIPRPISHIAENVTTINSEQIALLNAHTLADVLQTIPGIQLDFLRTPGSLTPFTIQGAPSAHLQVLIDGVPQNELINNVSDVGSIPVLFIDRIEIVKGAASAAWGPALGGVVNVITKSPDPEKKFSGSGLASYGERATSDLQGEVSGTVDRLGYYFSGGNLHSKGLRPNNGVNNNSLFGKLVYDLPEKGTITLGVNYRTTDRGTTASPPDFFDYQEAIKVDYFSGYLSLLYPLGDRLSLDLLAREWRQRYENTEHDFSGQLIHTIGKNDQTIRGATAKLNWGDSLRNLVTGVEYEHAEVSNDLRIAPDLDTPIAQERTMDRYGVFTNGSWTIGALTILPGIRYDRTGISSDFVSSTLGATLRLSEKTTLRTYGARAYSLPYALLLEGLQKVWTVQAGLESSDIPYVWLKGTFFYNNVQDQSLDFSTTPTTAFNTKSTRQGFEAEARSIPVYGFTLAGGYTYTDARDRDTNEQIKGIPTNLAKLSLQYNNAPIGLRGILTGNYVWWNGPDDLFGSYKPVVWDLSLTQTLFPGRELSPELFFSAHNLFNGSQYQINTVSNNPSRWIEGGVRFRF